MKSFAQHQTQRPLTEAFTRQHYAVIANAISKAHDDVLDAERNSDDPGEVIERLAIQLATIFKNDNTRFDKGYFLNACGF